MPELSWRRRLAALGAVAAASTAVVFLPLSGSGPALRADASHAVAASLGDHPQIDQSLIAAKLHMTWHLRSVQAAAPSVAPGVRPTPAQVPAVAVPAASPVPAPPPPPGAVVLTAVQVGLLWLGAGGALAAEQTAVCIAWHESQFNRNAVSPTNDYGLWQINKGNAGLLVNGFTIVVSLDPLTNARDAVALSRDGTNWSDWTTAPACGV